MTVYFNTQELVPLISCKTLLLAHDDGIYFVGYPNSETDNRIVVYSDKKEWQGGDDFCEDISPAFLAQFTAGKSKKIKVVINNKDLQFTEVF